MLIACATGVGFAALGVGREVQSPAGITSVPGILVGHHTLKERPTGLHGDPRAAVGDGRASKCEAARPARVRRSCSRPKTPSTKSTRSCSSGGSAFGLDAATGVMRFLGEKGIGYMTSAGVVPIVPAAILFDLGGGRTARRSGPMRRAGTEAARQAKAGPIEEGSVGAGAGATVGKTVGREPRDERRHRHRGAHDT